MSKILGMSLALLTLTTLLGQDTSKVVSPTQGSVADDGLWYLLVSRAGRGAPETGGQERNYYDLARRAQFLEPQRHNTEEIARCDQEERGWCAPRCKALHRGCLADIVTDHSVRYDVYRAWKVRVLRSSQSNKTPISTGPGVYVLIYPRNPAWIFCATKYRIETLKDLARRIIYTDFEDGSEYTLHLSNQWPRDWQVHQVEILNSNAFPEILPASSRASDAPYDR